MGGKVFVITGASGSGKTTLAMAALEDPQLSLSKVITCTSRAPRGEEKNGVDYRFFTRPEFEKMAEEGKFFEHAEVYGNYYGSLKEDVNAILESGKNVLFVVDVQGAEYIKKRHPKAITIFVKAPSVEEMKRRLEGRRQDSPEKIKERLEQAMAEEEKAPLFDHTLMNDVLEDAVEEIKRIIREAMSG